MSRLLLCLVLAALALSQDAPLTRVPLRLMVVDSSSEAEAALQKLNGGADFAVLAREKSVDPTSVDGGLMARNA